MEISVVIPVYGCPSALQPLCERLIKTLEKIHNEYEIILVNDHCPKNSWNVIKDICKTNTNIIGLDLSKNFGQQKAILAGLDISKGNYVVVMDCDLQDKPEDIELLYKEITNSEYDMVFAKIHNNQSKKLTSKLFYKFYSKILNIKYDSDLSNFGIFKRVVIDSLTLNRETQRGFTLFIKLNGFKQGFIEIERDKRFEGKSGYNFKKRLKLAMSLIFSQSDWPIKILLKFSIFLSVFSFLGLLSSVIVFLILKKYSLLSTFSIIFVILLCTGIINCTISINSMYTYNSYIESKRKPLYYIREKIN